MKQEQSHEQDYSDIALVRMVFSLGFVAGFLAGGVLALVIMGS